MGDYFQYWARILGALALIKVASTLVKDAEKLITANVKARNPEIADVIDDAVVVHEFEITPQEEESYSSLTGEREERNNASED